jgi:hypothetical protein
MARSTLKGRAMHWKWWLLAPPVVAVMVYITYDDFGLWPSLAFFAVVIPAAFYFYRQDSRRLGVIMKPIAARHGGTFRPATAMNFPQLHFEADGRRYAVHAMPNAGASAPPGPFTFVQLTLPFDSSFQADIRRTRARIRGAVAAMAPEWQATTGDPVFDQAFRLEGSDQANMALPKPPLKSRR